MYITYFVYRNITSASDSANSTTGLALSPIAAQAAPNIKQKTTTCRTSFFAIASMMLDGNVCSRMAVRLGVAAGAGAAAGADAEGAGACNPTPGFARFTM